MALAGNIPGNYTVTVNPIAGSLPGAQITVASIGAVGKGTALSFSGGSVVFDSGSPAFANLAVHPTRLTAPAAGVYLVAFNATTNVATAVTLNVNGTPVQQPLDYGPFNDDINGSWIVKLAANDYIEIFNEASIGVTANFVNPTLSIQQIQ